MLTLMGIAANTHGIQMDGTTIEITKIMAADPRRVAEVKIDFTFPGLSFSDKEKIILERAARTCPVALSLSDELVQSIRFNW